MVTFLDEVWPFSLAARFSFFALFFSLLCSRCSRSELQASQPECRLRSFLSLSLDFLPFFLDPGAVSWSLLPPPPSTPDSGDVVEFSISSLPCLLDLPPFRSGLGLIMPLILSLLFMTSRRMVGDFKSLGGGGGEGDIRSKCSLTFLTLPARIPPNAMEPSSCSDKSRSDLVLFMLAIIAPGLGLLSMTLNLDSETARRSLRKAARSPSSILSFKDLRSTLPCPPEAAIFRPVTLPGIELLIIFWSLFSFWFVCKDFLGGAGGSSSSLLFFLPVSPGLLDSWSRSIGSAVLDSWTTQICLLSTVMSSSGVSSSPLLSLDSSLVELATTTVGISSVFGKDAGTVWSIRTRSSWLSVSWGRFTQLWIAACSLVVVQPLNHLIGVVNLLCLLK